MSAKHRHPKPRPMADLEKRVRRIERNWQRDLAKAVHNAYEAGQRNASQAT